jgi:hypothetical protein
LRKKRAKAKSHSMPCRTLRIRSGWFGGAAVFVLAAAILLTLCLSATPNLHERVHPTSASIHECAVTLIASGVCHHGNASPLMIAPAAAVQLSKIPALIPHWVESPFLRARIFEHAPPTHS